MTNRVLLDLNGLKISKPGWDVTTAPEGALQYNSAWAGAQVLITGSLYRPNGSPDLDIWFGRWFSKPPMVLLIAQQPDTNNTKFTLNAPPYDWGGSYVTNDRFRLRTGNNPYTPSGVYYDYFIWNYAP